MADRSVRPLRHLVHAVTGGQPPSEAQVRQAAWIARCVGRGGSAPLHRDDVSALAETLQVKEFAPGRWYSTPIKPRTGCGLCDTD